MIHPVLGRCQPVRKLRNPVKTAFHHFVPRFVLREFANLSSNPRKHKYRVAVCDLQDNKTFTANVDRVAGQTKFYDYSTRSGKLDSIEPTLTKIEGVTAPAWRKLIAMRTCSALSADERSALSLFIVTLLVRGPATRAEITALPGKVTKELTARGENTTELERWLTGESGDDERVHVNIVREIGNIYPHIAARDWRLCRPPSGRRFCTSDNPVLRYNEIDYGPMGNLGLLQFGITLQVALSPELLLLIVDPRAYQLPGSEVIQFDEDNLLHYNSMLAFWAHRYLYAQDPDDFEVRSGMRHPGSKVVIGPDRPS